MAIHYFIDSIGVGSRIDRRATAPQSIGDGVECGVAQLEFETHLARFFLLYADLDIAVSIDIGIGTGQAIADHGSAAVIIGDSDTAGSGRTVGDHESAGNDGSTGSGTGG